MDKTRLNRLIASSGLCSRRDADLLIKEGRVTVNGVVVVDFHTPVDERRDQIAVDRKLIKRKKLEYIMLNKPKGVITTCDDERGRRSVIDLLPDDLKHLNPVGRLDRDSEGLLLLTNDGNLAQNLTHPSSHIGKTYKVSVEGRLTRAIIDKLTKGLDLDGQVTAPAIVKVVNFESNHTVFEITLTEGRNRQVRRMCASQGLTVRRLVRTAIGGLQLKSLKSGTWRRLSESEVKGLLPFSPRR